jgi:hypothetical protein
MSVTRWGNRSLALAEPQAKPRPSADAVASRPAVNRADAGSVFYTRPRPRRVVLARDPVACGRAVAAGAIGSQRPYAYARARIAAPGASSCGTSTVPAVAPDFTPASSTSHPRGAPGVARRFPLAGLACCRYGASSTASAVVTVSIGKQSPARSMPAVVSPRRTPIGKATGPLAPRTGALRTSYARQRACVSDVTRTGSLARLMDRGYGSDEGANVTAHPSRSYRSARPR